MEKKKENIFYISDTILNGITDQSQITC